MLRILVLLTWWLGCEVDSATAPGPGPSRPPAPAAPTSTECDQAGGQWLPAPNLPAGGRCQLTPPQVASPVGPDGGIVDSGGGPDNRER